MAIEKENVKEVKELTNDTKYAAYYNENVFEDEEKLMEIFDITAGFLYDKFRIDLKEDPRLVGVVCRQTYEAIMKQLEELERDWAEYEINICDRLLMGYSTSSNEDDEKSGNFMIYIRHLNNSKKTQITDEDRQSDTPVSVRTVSWVNENVTAQAELLRKISIKALESLKDLDVFIGKSECVLVIFIIAYEAMIKVLMNKREELDEFEYEVNFMNCFTIGARENAEGNSDIYIVPSIDAKLTIKNDEKATGKYE